MAYSKFTPTRAKKITEHLRSGIGRTAASKLAGIEIRTLQDWTRRNPDFARQLIEAEEEGEQAQIDQAMHKDYTPERVEKVLNFLKAGNTREAAAKAAGVLPSVFEAWREYYPDFRAQVDEAEAIAEQAHVANVARAATSGRQWTASAWWLERRRPEDWGRVDRVELIVRQRQAEHAAEELRREGINVTPDELLNEADTMAKHALPPGRR